MTPESPTDPRQALEASLTAMLLGELPEDQAAFLRQAIASDPELARMHERLKVTIGLVRETASTPVPQAEAKAAPLRLSDEKRQQLLQRFKTVEPKQFKRSRNRRLVFELAAAACVIGLLGVTLLPTLNRAKTRSMSRLGGRAHGFYRLQESLSANSTPEPAAPAEPQAVPVVSAPPPSQGQSSPSGGRLSQTVIVLPQGTELADAGNASRAKLENNPLTQRERQGLTSAIPPTLADRSADDTFATAPVVAPTAQPVTGTATASEQPKLPMLFEGDHELALRRSAAPRQQEMTAANGAPLALAQSVTPPAQVAESRPSRRLEQQISRSKVQDGLKNSGDLSAVPNSAAGNALAWNDNLHQKQGAAGLNEAAVRYYFQQRAYSETNVGSFGGGVGGGVAGNTLIAAPSNANGPLLALDDNRSAADQLSENRTKVPTLGNVPLLGRLYQSQSNKTLELASEEKQLQELQHDRTVLTMKLANQKSDSDLPKSSTVEIIDRAVPDQKPTVGEKIRSALGGEVTRSARIQLEPGQTEIAGTSNLQRAAGYDPYFVQSEFETIQSDKVLGQVVDKLHLQDEFAKKKGATVSKEQAVALLKKDLELKPVKGTGVIEIGARSKSPEEAAKIANAVSDAYLADRAETRRDLSSAGVAALSGRLQETEARIKEVQSNLDSSRVKLASPDSTSAAETRGVSSDIIPPGMIDFRGADLNQVLSVYADLSGRTLLRPSSFPATNPPITFEVGKPISRADAIKKLDNILASHGVSVVAVGDKFFEAIPAAQAGVSGQSLKAQDDIAPAKPKGPLPEPQPEIQTRENAFSTFSMNVSDVSFKLAAASLEKGVLPDPASIRSEEFINAFDYRDPEAPPGVPITFAWERGQYPFAQGRDLLRFSIKTAAQGRQAGRPLNLVLLLDNSGSMERADRVQIIHEALRVLATQLSAQDVLSVVTFARTPRLWVDGAPGTEAAKVAEDVSGLTPQGGTNLGDALDLAYETARRHYLANGINRVVLLTDGAANLGDVNPDSLKQKVEANRKQGIALDCFGIGWEDYNDDLLETLTRNADGRYGFLNTPQEAATEFAGQLAGALQVAASDVKVQVEFNPNRVTAYRQIGYAKLQLTKEQFRDNTVNAAQIGAAESGNALYVIDVNGGGDGPLATVRVRYRVPGTQEYHEQAWTVPYTGTALPLEQSSPALRLAATAAAFSEWLATSPYAGEVTPDRLLGYLNGVPAVYGPDARPQKLGWMIRQAKSLVGK